MPRFLIAAYLILAAPALGLQYEARDWTAPAEANSSAPAGAGNVTHPRAMPAAPLSTVRVVRKMLSQATPSEGHPYICAVGTKTERRVITKVLDDDAEHDEEDDDKPRTARRNKLQQIHSSSEAHKPGQTIKLGKSGFNLTIIKVGDGKSYPRSGDTLVTHYTGKLNDGTVFETSRNKKKPFEFTVGVHEVIKGIDEGIMRMSMGERGVLHVPAAMAYGKTGTGDGMIPRNADLDYDMELLKIQRN